MRDDAGAGPEFLQQLGAQLHGHIREQVERHHARPGQVRLEEVLHLEGDLVGNPVPDRIPAGEVDQRRIEIHTEPARAEAPCCDDRNAPVPRTQVDQEIARPHFGHAQHAEHHFVPADHKGREVVVLRLARQGNQPDYECAGRAPKERVNHLGRHDSRACRGANGMFRRRPAVSPASVRKHSAQDFLRLLFIGLTRLLHGQQDCCDSDEDPVHERAPAGVKAGY